MLPKVLCDFVDQSWDNDIIPQYKEYDLVKPHCNLSVSYRAVDGKLRFKCKHEVNTMKNAYQIEIQRAITDNDGEPDIEGINVVIVASSLQEIEQRILEKFGSEWSINSLNNLTPSVFTDIVFME